MKKICILATVILVISILALPQIISADVAEGEAENDEFSYITIYPDDYQPPENSKIVYLTFDDGPTQYTPQILEILAKHDIKATFFVVGNRAHNHYMRDIVAGGHAIGLHSYNHDFDQIYRSKEAFFGDFQKIDDIVHSETGIRSNIMRFPGGSSVKRGSAKAIMPALKEEVHNRGYQFFDWNCDSRDKMGVKTVSGAMTKIKSATKDADDIIIVLMHDTEKITVQYLPDVIVHFRELGYDFLPLCINSPAIHHTW